ncbi:MAG: hypothetical protein WDM91_01570 [Rhizomicrobium sp.]
MIGRFALVATALLCGGAFAAAGWQRGPAETALQFAERVLAVAPDAEPDALEARWNGRPVIFASYMHPSGQDSTDRLVVMLDKAADGSYRKIDVTTGEEEGGAARVEAIGFANADRDPAQELIVILSWNTEHYDVSGTFYEVRIFDDAAVRGQLTYLKAVSAHFGGDCDCTWRDGKTKHFRFKTIAAVKAELKRMGF